MHRSRAGTDSQSCAEHKSKEGGGGRRHRWSFAFRRRWFSTSSRDSKGDDGAATPPGTCDAAGILAVPRQTTLGSTWHSDAPSSSCTDRPEAGNSSSSVVKRKSLR
ncbi:hypothetical protein ANCCAN_16123 [Ancylostoma caninum]|uniref:Uncharacterized protein n=1 Tax=Ancylostoma caninum TaxID=29170 RepID=A0A368G0M2_ANCCA|nr:hypothetical protein ANCCAN_16123 [Ancylostoma caninum]